MAHGPHGPQLLSLWPLFYGSIHALHGPTTLSGRQEIEERFASWYGTFLAETGHARFDDDSGVADRRPAPTEVGHMSA